MDILTKFAAHFFPDLLAAAGIKLVDSIREINPDLNIKNKQESDAFVQRVVGNSGPDQLMAIERYLGRVLQQHRTIVLRQQTKERLDEYFGGLESCLANADITYNRFLEDKCPTTWKLFSDAVNFGERMVGLFTRIQNDSDSQKKILNDFFAFCDKDLEKYKTWQRAVYLMFSRAYFLRTAFFYYATFSDKSYDENAKTKELHWTINLPQYAQSEILAMEFHLREVVRLMERNYQVVRTYFLVLPCDDPHHKQHCGASDDDQCCELGARVYKLLRNEKKSNNQDLATAIAIDLQSAYKHFQWSVVVFPGQDPRDPECVISDNHRSGIWFHRSGSESDNSIKKPVRGKVVISDGLGAYGCFVCYKIRNFSKKTAVVFWAEPDSVLLSAKSYDRLKDKWSTRKLKSQLSTGDIHKVTNWMRTEQEGYVFGVGLQLKSDKETIGMHLANKEDRTFPMCLLDDAGLASVLVWPELSTSSDQVLECKLVKGPQEPLIVGVETKSKLYKGQLDGVQEHQFVAIKEILVSLKHEERKTQIAALAAILGPLKKFSHPHIVKHLGFQIVAGAAAWEIPRYQIIMELCTGGSLTDRVKGQTVTLAEIFMWSKGILEGLTYLYLHHIRHNKIQGDHLLFPGPEQGDGAIKIIALGRADHVIWQTTRSFEPITANAQRYIPFQAPATDSKTGSKTDIWSFGCVLIQMVTGNPPVLIDAVYKGQKIKIPVVPQGIPTVLKTVIDRCLALEYDNRPSAATVLGVRVFDEKSCTEMDWVSPPRVL